MTDAFDQPHPPTPASPPANGRTVLIITAVVAAIVGVVLGGGIGYLLFADRADGTALPRAEQDVAEGCAVLERIEDDLPVDTESTSIDDPVVFELLGAGHLFMAASRADESFEVVAELGKDLVAGITRLDLDLVNETSAELQTECADR